MAKDYFAEEMGNASPKDYFSEEVQTVKPRSLFQKVAEPTIGTMGLVLGAGVLFAGGKQLAKAKIPSKARRFILENVAGYSKPTVETVEKEGFKTIGRIQKQGVGNYISDIIPQVKDKLINYFTGKNVDPTVLEEIGFHPDDIDIIKDIPKERVNVIKGLKTKSLFNTVEQITKEKQIAGKTIGRAEKLAKQIGIPDYIPNTYKTIRGELNRLGYLKGDAIAQDVSAVKDKALRGLLTEWVGLRKDPIYPYDISDIQKLRTNLEASLGGEPRFDRIVYKVLDTLKEEHTSNIDRVEIPSIKKLNIRKANKDYSDSVKLEKLVSKIKDVVEKEPTKFVERFKGSVMDVMKEPTRQRFKQLFGDKLYNKLKSAVATAEIYPLKQERIGLMQAGIKGVGKGLFRTMQGAKKVGGKAILGLSPATFITDAMKLQQDPEAYQISAETGQDYWEVKKNLGSKGSEERKIQLGQIA